MNARARRAVLALTGLLDQTQTTLENLAQRIETTGLPCQESPFDGTGISFTMLDGYLKGAADQCRQLRQLTHDPHYLAALADMMEEQ